jgi:hypothetical protein
MAKGFLTIRLRNAIAKSFESLISVKVCEALVVPTTTSPNLNGSLGLNFSFGRSPANADPAVAVSRNNNEKARPAIDRVDDLERIFQIPPYEREPTIRLVLLFVLYVARPCRNRPKCQNRTRT